MFEGVDIIFIIPLALVVIVALAVGVWQFSKHGAKRAVISVVISLVSGVFLLFVLFAIWVGIYYAGGGH